MSKLKAYFNLLMLAILYLVVYIIPLGVLLFVWCFLSTFKIKEPYKPTIVELVKKFDKLINLFLVGDCAIDWRGVLDYRANIGSDTAKELRYIIDVLIMREKGYIASHHKIKFWYIRPGWNLPF